MYETINFESIQQWNGASGSGKDARLLLDRNFQKIKEFLSLIGFGILSDGSIEQVVGKTQEEYDAMPEHDPKTWYIILDPDQQSSIEQILAELSTAIDAKADANAVADFLQELITTLAGKANQQDLLSLATALATSVVDQSPNWVTIFGKNGSWVFVDDDHAINRPGGFPVPPAGAPIKYNVHTFSASPSSLPSALVRNMDNKQLFILTLEEDVLITVQRMVDLVDGKIPVEQLPEGSGVADGSVTPGKIASGVLEGAFDWMDIFKKEGHWIIVDNGDAINRPYGLALPGTGETVQYKGIVYGVSEGIRPSALISTHDSYLGQQSYELEYSPDIPFNIYAIPIINNSWLQANLYLEYINHTLWTETSATELDSLFGCQEISMAMAIGESILGLSSFNLKVFDACEDKVVQHIIKGDKLWSRSYDMGTSIWSDWILIGEDQNKYVLNIDFTVATPFVYNVPQAMKFTSMAFEGTAPALSIALNTNMARYNKLTITPSSIGLVTLTGTLL